MIRELFRVTSLGLSLIAFTPLVFISSSTSFNSNPQILYSPRTIPITPASEKTQIIIPSLEEQEELEEDDSIVPVVKEDFSQDYSSNKYVSSYSWITVTGNDGKTYDLFKPTKKMNFSIPAKATRERIYKIRIEDIKILLLKTPVWSKPDIKEDEYQALTESQIKSLFDGKNRRKIKELLLSLSNRRWWTKIDNPQNTYYYYPVGDWVTSVSEQQLKIGVKIRYFKDFEAFKSYVHRKIKTCSSDGKCEASPDELNIMDQDKLSFFELK